MRLNNKFISFLILFTSIVIEAQSIKITVHDLSTRTATIYSLQGEKTFLLDSIESNSNNRFSYTFDNSKTTAGIYRLSFSNNKVVDFIYDGGSVELITNANNILDSMHIVNSESNRLFYSFIKLNKQFKIKTELLQLILARYPKDDSYYRTTENKLTQLQNEYIEFVNVTAQKNPLLFVSRYIRSAQLPVVDLSIPPEKQLQYLKSHALDYINFNDASLINSDVFTNKTIEYLTYFRNPQLPKELLEQEFMKAVDTLLNKAKVNQLVYQHITEYLIDGFKKFGFDKILDYIVENYVIKDDLCLDVKTEGMIQRRIEQAKLFKIGSIVPNIILPDSAGKQIELNKIAANRVLIIFYASWCPHCKELLPKLDRLIKDDKEKKIEVFAISLDTQKEDWLKFIRENCSSFINVCDLKGWDGKAASDYFIYATPTMFLVDKERRIISEPMNYEDIINLKINQ